MILEWIEYLRTPASPLARKMGYLSELVAIQFRRDRNKKGWSQHLDQTQKQILTLSRELQRRESIALLGAGVVSDIPLQKLLELFQSVILVDLVFSRETRRLASSNSKIRLIEADITGVLQSILDTHSVPPPHSPSIPGLEGASLVVSVNILSQLGIMPIRYLDRYGISDQAQEQLDRNLITAHLTWLSTLPVPALLITDVSEGDLDLMSGVSLASTFPLLLNHWEWRLDSGQTRRVEARMVEPLHPH